MSEIYAAPLARIRWGVKTVKTSPFLKYNAIFFSGSMVIAALNYFFYPVLGRLLQPADFGEVQTLTSLFTQAAILLTILSYVTIHVTVNVTDEAERNRRLLGLERAAMIGGYALLLIMLLLVGEMRNFLHFKTVWPFVALIAALALSIPQAFRQAFLRGRKEFTKVSMLGIIGSAAKLIIGPLLVLVGWHSFGAITGLALAQVITLAYCFVWARKAGFKGSGFSAQKTDFNSLRPQLKHGSAILLASGSIVIMQTLDMISIKHFFSPYQSGLYAGITTIASIVFFLMAPIAGVLVTMVSVKHSQEKNRLHLRGTIALMILLGGAALAVMALIPNFTIQLMVGSKYLTYAHFLPRIGLVMLLLALASAVIMYHIALNRYRYMFVAPVGLLITGLLISLSHASIAAIINDLLVGSACILLLVVGQSLILQPKLERSADEPGS